MPQAINLSFRAPDRYDRQDEEQFRRAVERTLVEMVNGDLDYDGGFRQTHEFYEDNLAASRGFGSLIQYNNAGTAYPTRWYAIRPGSVTGMAFFRNGTQTGGIGTIFLRKNGSVVTTLASLPMQMLVGTDGTNRFTVNKDHLRFAAGDYFEVDIQTDGAYAPATLDVRVVLEVET